MSRQIDHEQMGRRKCKCGASFKTDGDLRRHLSGGGKNEPRVIWINTALPKGQKEARRRSSW